MRAHQSQFRCLLAATMGIIVFSGARQCVRGCVRLSAQKMENYLSEIDVAWQEQRNRPMYYGDYSGAKNCLQTLPNGIGGKAVWTKVHEILVWLIHPFPRLQQHVSFRRHALYVLESSRKKRPNLVSFWAPHFLLWGRDPTVINYRHLPPTFE